MTRLYPFTYYGSKYRGLRFILDRLPATNQYVEPFGGSGVVLLNREKSPHEVLNDLNGEIINFFDVLRDHTEELVERLQLTPYSREEFERSVQRRGDVDDPIERARLFFIRTQQGRYGSMDEARTKGEWARSTTQVRGADPGNPMKVNKILSRVDDLPAVAERLRRVQVEKRDALEVIQDYDDPETLFYLDPPYPSETRGGDAYGEYEFTTQNHEDLIDVILDVDGFVALSGYDNELYNTRLDGWYISRAEKLTNANGTTGEASENSQTQEVLWSNYDPDKRIGGREIQSGVGEWT